MSTTEKRHTLPDLPRILPSHLQSAAIPPGPLTPNSANVSGVGYVGRSVEVKHDGSGFCGYGGYGGIGSMFGSEMPRAIPQTPAPAIGFGTPAPTTGKRGGEGTGKAFDGDVQEGGGPDEYDGTVDIEGGNGGQSIVVSVGILPQHHP